MNPPDDVPSPADAPTPEGVQATGGDVQPTGDERNWATFSHAGPVLAILVSAGTLGWLVPLIIYLVKGDESRFTRENALEALNFQIAVWVVTLSWALVSTLLICVGIGIPMLFLAPLLYLVPTLVYGILGALASNRGEVYRYPYTIRLVS